MITFKVGLDKMGNFNYVYLLHNFEVSINNVIIYNHKIYWIELYWYILYFLITQNY